MKSIPAVKLQYGEAEKPSDVIARISAERPTAVPGILSLVQQSQSIYVLVCVVDLVRRSSSVYRSFSALAALLWLSLSYSNSVDCSSVYPSFAADGCIFYLETLARSLGDSCEEKEYLLVLVDLGRAVHISSTSTRYFGTLRAELLDAIFLQQYVSSLPTQSYLILFIQSA